MQLTYLGVRSPLPHDRFDFIDHLGNKIQV